MRLILPNFRFGIPIGACAKSLKTIGAEGGNRTHTPLARPRILRSNRLSPANISICCSSFPSLRYKKAFRATLCKDIQGLFVCACCKLGKYRQMFLQFPFRMAPPKQQSPVMILGSSPAGLQVLLYSTASLQGGSPIPAESA